MTDQSQHNTVQTRQYLWSLASVKPMIQLLKNSGKTYDPLIDQILMCSDDECPSYQELQKDLQIKPGKLRKWILDLYNDFMELIGSRALILDFRATRICFSVSSSEGTMSFDCYLSHLPRVGDRITLPFLYATTGLGFVYVQQVSFTLENNQLKVLIIADSTEPLINDLKEWALFEGQLSYYEASRMSKYELEKFLKSTYGHQAWPVGLDAKMFARRRR